MNALVVGSTGGYPLAALVYAEAKDDADPLDVAASVAATEGATGGATGGIGLEGGGGGGGGRDTLGLASTSSSSLSLSDRSIMFD